MNEEQLQQITEETYHFLNNKGVGFACYIWDKDGEYGGGCNSADADTGDAMVAISKLVKHFSIHPEALYRALLEAKVEQEES